MGQEDVEELREQVRSLTTRVWQLEQRLGVPPSAPPVAAPRREPETVPAEPVWRAPPAPEARDLETLLGARWLAALGTLVLVLGGAWFVIFFLGEALQILSGVAGGAALAATGVVLHRRARYGAYPGYLVAGGIVLAYFALFAGYAFPEYRAATGLTLLSDAVLLAAVAAAAVGLAWWMDSRALAGEGFLLGFLTAILARGGEPAVQILALLYVAGLAAGLLAVVALKRWTEVGVGGAVGTWIVLAALRPDSAVAPLLFGGVVVLVAAELWALAVRASAHDVPFGTVAALVASAGAAALLWWHVELVRAGSGQHVLLALALLHAGAAFAPMAPSLRGASGLLAAGLGFLWAPDAYDGWVVTVVWAALLSVLAAFAARAPNRWLLTAVYAGAGALIARVLFWDAPDLTASEAARLEVTLAVAAATAALASAYVLLAGARLPEDERGVGPIALLAAAALAPLPWLFFRLEQWASVGWAVEGALLVAAGFAADRKEVRMAGIGILLLVVGRVLLVDASRLTVGWRVVVFLAVGALVLGAAFLFARRRPQPGR